MINHLSDNLQININYHRNKILERHVRPKKHKVSNNWILITF
jgi:hypothetical protein